MSKTVSPEKIRIWDIPTRLFHWSLVLVFALSWLTRNDQQLYVHLLSGYLFLGLLLFRFVWGIAGSRYARFNSFSFHPRQALSYLKGLWKKSGEYYPGHNPAGSWAIYLILFLGTAISVTGILTLGSEEVQGPVAGIFTIETGLVFHEIHEVLAWSLLVLAGLHVAGVAVESILHRENLPKAMFNGYKKRHENSAIPELPVARHPVIAFFMLVAISVFSAWWLQGYLTETEENPFIPFTGPDLSFNELWEEECGACHLAYHPSLLPSRSWQEILKQQANHFDEDLSLEPDTVNTLLAYSQAHSAETVPTETAWKILHSIELNETPLQITETGYWKLKHQDIKKQVWEQDNVNGRYNCDACHLDAFRGTFEDGAMRIPATTL